MKPTVFVRTARAVGEWSRGQRGTLDAKPEHGRQAARSKQERGSPRRITGHAVPNPANLSLIRRRLFALLARRPDRPNEEEEASSRS